MDKTMVVIDIDKFWEQELDAKLKVLGAEFTEEKQERQELGRIRIRKVIYLPMFAKMELQKWLDFRKTGGMIVS